MANGSGGISFQGILTTTKTQLQLSANNSIRAFGAANKHSSNAINVTIYAFPNPNLRTHTYEAVASAGSDLILTVYGG